MADNIIIEGGFFSDKQIIAEDFATAFSGLVSNGVLETIDNNALKVTAGTGMNLNVSRGYFWIDGQFGKNGTSTVVTIDIGDSEYSRYDRIVARVNKTTKTVEIGVLKGTANANPVAPDITRDGTIFELSLATIEIPATATELTTANIQDNRADTDLCGFCSPKFDEIDTSAVFDGFYAEWEQFKGQLANDPAGNLQFQIGNLNNLETENKENLVKAINETTHTVDGIPVDLTGIYNTQVIGYDETTGTLVPMMNVARTEIVIPNTITPVPWVAILGELNENTTQPSFTLSDELPKAIVRFTMPYTLSEFTTMKIGIYHYNTKDVLHKVRFSKTYDFSVVEAEYSVQGWSSSSDTVTCDITNLTGTYYMEVEFNRYQDNTRAVLTSLSFSA